MVETVAKVAMSGWLLTAMQPHFWLSVITRTVVPAMAFTAKAKIFMVVAEKISTSLFLKALSLKTCTRVKYSPTW
jgi:hypothetical protein